MACGVDVYATYRDAGRLSAFNNWILRYRLTTEDRRSHVMNQWGAELMRSELLSPEFKESIRRAYLAGTGDCDTACDKFFDLQQTPRGSVLIFGPYRPWLENHKIPARTFPLGSDSRVSTFRVCNMFWSRPELAPAVLVYTYSVTEYDRTTASRFLHIEGLTCWE